MKKFILQLIAILVYKATKLETKTFKKMFAEYKQREAEYRKKAAALQAELDEEHMRRFGWDSKTINA